jgi:hypothetical protein
MNGHIQVLEWFKNSGYEFKYNFYAISHAAMHGHIQVLNWFKNSGYEINYSEVLDWFKNSGYDNPVWAINFAFYYKHNQVLELLKNNFNVKKFIKSSNSDYNTIKNRTVSLIMSACFSSVKKNITTSNSDYIKTIKYKTKNNYMKSYNKN